jgi:small subunit ribosomal protein S4e
MTHQKRLSAPKHYPIERKHYSYVSGIKGSRSSETAIPAVLFLRDVTEYAESEKEAKQIIRNGQLLRNGERVRDVKEGIGVLDVVTLEEVDEAYRVIIEGDDLRFVEVDDSEKTIARIEDKETEGDEFIYHLHNGDNYRTEENFQTGSSLLLNGDAEEVEREEGAKVLVVSGKHAGEVAELTDIQRRNLDEDTGTVEKDDREFSTQLENLVAVKEIDLGE